MKLRSILAAASVAATLAGFWTPQANAASRYAYCDSYARHEADNKTHAGDVLAGTVGGALTGALLGGIIDGGKGAGRGAIIGGVGGTVVGAGATSNKWNKVYRKKFDACMSGYSPEPVYYDSPEPGTKAWYRYCSAKYRSFNPSTGMYLSSSGRYKPCR